MRKGELIVVVSSLNLKIQIQIQFSSVPRRMVLCFIAGELREANKAGKPSSDGEIYISS